MRPDPATVDEEIRRLEEMAVDEAGVDVTQIDMMLSLTPRERLACLYETAMSLARLIDVKERAGRPKDLAVLPLLRSTLARARDKL